jgi:hypothetical protein
MTKSSLAISKIAAVLSPLNFRRVGHFLSWFVSLTKLSADDRRAHKTRDLCTSLISDRNRRIPFYIESGYWRVRLRRTPMFWSLLSLKIRFPHLSTILIRRFFTNMVNGLRELLAIRVGQFINSLLAREGRNIIGHAWDIAETGCDRWHLFECWGIIKKPSFWKTPGISDPTPVDEWWRYLVVKPLKKCIFSSSRSKRAVVYPLTSGVYEIIW